MEYRSFAARALRADESAPPSRAIAPESLLFLVAAGHGPGPGSSDNLVKKHGVPLRSPRSGQPLARDGDNLVTPDGCERYPLRNGIPLLVDPNDSIVGQTLLARDAESEIERPKPRGLGSLVKRLLSPTKPETRRNISAFCAALKQDSPAPIVLVIGGGTAGQGTSELYDDPAIRRISFDIYRSPAIDFVADAHRIPLGDQSVDGVLIQAVLEHVLEPDRVVSEVWRVLKKGGVVYSETPFLQQVHEGAYDFSRFTHSGHRYLFRWFSVIDSGPCGGAGTQLLWSIDYFVRGLFRSRTMGKLAKLSCFWLAYFDRLIPSPFTVDSASGFYLLGRKADAPLSPSEIVGLYAGAQ
jgi:SAM-dependent methyltransferase